MHFNSVKEAMEWLSSLNIPDTIGLNDPIKFQTSIDVLNYETMVAYKNYIEKNFVDATKRDWDYFVSAVSEMFKNEYSAECCSAQSNMRVEIDKHNNFCIYGAPTRIKNLFVLYVMINSMWKMKYGAMGRNEEVTVYDLRSSYKNYLDICPNSSAIVAIRTSGGLGRIRIFIDGSDEGLLTILLNYINMLVEQTRGEVPKRIYARTMLEMLFEAMDRADKNLNLEYGRNIQALCPERELKEHQSEFNVPNRGKQKTLFDNCLESMMGTVLESDFAAERAEENSLTAHISICQNDGSIMHVNSVTRGNVVMHLHLAAYVFIALVMRSEYIAEQQSKPPYLNRVSVGRLLYTKLVTDDVSPDT